MNNADRSANAVAEPRRGRRIVAAALLLADGRIICGVRHFDKIMRTTINGMSDGKPDKLLKGAVQGFVCNDYEFEGREASWLIALRAGQLDPDKATGQQGTLYSEDLW